MTNAPARTLVAFAAVFTVRHVGQSLAFYRDHLAFQTCFALGDPPSYAIIERDAVSLHLMPASQDASGLGTSCIYEFAEAVDDLYALHALSCPIEETHYLRLACSSGGRRECLTSRDMSDVSSAA